jgi:hypothetical protein
MVRLLARCACSEADAGGIGDDGELVGQGLVEAAEPERALLARIGGLPALTVGDALREHRADLGGQLVQRLRRHARRVVAHGQRAVAEPCLDREHAGAPANPLEQDLEAAFAVGDYRGMRRRGFGRARGGRAHHAFDLTTRLTDTAT